MQLNVFETIIYVFCTIFSFGYLLWGVNEMTKPNEDENIPSLLDRFFSFNLVKKKSKLQNPEASQN